MYEKETIQTQTRRVNDIEQRTTMIQDNIDDKGQEISSYDKGDSKNEDQKK